MPCVKVKLGNDWAIVNFAPPTRTIKSGGKTFSFEFHDFLGPGMIGKRGEPVQSFPPRKSPFWDALHFWLKQGKRVESDGNCIFEHEMRLVHILKQIGPRELILLG